MQNKFGNYLKILIFIFFVMIIIIYISDFEFSGEKWSAILTSFTSVISLLGLTLVYDQLSEMKKQSKTQTDQMKQELEIVKLSKSLEKANEFREILDDCSLFTAVIQTDKKYTELIESKDSRDFEHFRFSELKKNFPNINDRKFLMDINDLITNNFIHIALIYQYSKLCNQGMDEEILKYSRYDWDAKKIAEKKYNLNFLNYVKDEEKLVAEIEDLLSRKDNIPDSESDKFLKGLKDAQNNLIKFKNFREDKKAMEILKNKVTYNIKDAINDLLNRLETWAMAFNIGLADGEAVYQSVHQAYLETVKYFYPTICRSNDKEIEDQYYTNIRDLYVCWSNKNATDKNSGEISATMRNKSKPKLD